MASQAERAQVLVGERVRFRSGIEAFRVVNVTPAGLVEIESHSGQFAPHLFVIVLEDGTEEIQLPSGFSLHVSADGWVWLDTEVAVHDGLCIGLGNDRRSALEHARDVLREALVHVEAELKAAR